MFSKLGVAFALFAASAQLVSATPPACLLAAVNTQPDPSDLGAICGKNSAKVQDQIKSLCNGAASDAMTAYKSTCKDNGHDVVVSSASPSATPTGSHSGTPSPSVKPSSSGSNAVTSTPVSGSASSSGAHSSASGSGSARQTSTPSVTALGSSGSGSSGARTSGFATATTSSAPATQSTGAAARTELSMFALVVAGFAAML